jgi:beta-lactamase class A
VARPLWPLSRLPRFAARERHARCTSAVCNGRSMTEATELADLLTTASRTGAVCVLDLDGVGAVTVNADQAVQAGSAFKIAIALEVYCQASAGQLDLDEHLRFNAERAAVSNGSIEQAIDLMLRLSDNAASNALLHRVTRKRIMARLASLGMTRTTVSRDVLAEVADITARLDKLAQTVGLPSWNQITKIVYDGRYEEIADRLVKINVDEQALPHEQMGPTTAARELATLYRMIWLDQAGPAKACAALRTAAGHQELTRLALGFDDTAGVSVAGKGGRIPGIILNDAGVITFPDGHRYAVAVFTRAHRAFDGELASYQLIGSIAATAIARLQR